MHTITRTLLRTYKAPGVVTSTAITVCAMLAVPTQHAAAIDLGGGTTTINLDAGSPQPIFTFKNTTNMRMHDVLLSTNDSDNIDPDFEGPIVVRRPPGGNSLGWTSSPTGDGIEDVKIQTADDANSLAINDEFTVEMVFDDVAAGDILRVTPTNKTGYQIQPAMAQSSLNTYRLFNGYAGLDGSLNLVYAGTSALTLPIASISFSSLASGVSVVSAESTLPSFFDTSTGTLVFDTPVAPGEEIDYLASINQLAPFSSGDPDPFTTVLARANAVPEPGSLVFASIALLALWTRKLLKRR